MVLSYLDRNGSKNLWSELDRIQDEISQSLFRSGGLVNSQRFPAVNLYQNDEEIVATILVPGYDPEGIQVHVEENKFIIKGTPVKEEKSEGFEFYRQEIGIHEFQRVLELPFRISADKVEANLKNGVLVVKLPKAEEDKPRKISVKIS
jgi:HSP20 family protein